MKVYCSECKYMFLNISYYLIGDFLYNKNNKKEHIDCSHPRNIIEIIKSDWFKKDVQFKSLLKPEMINKDNDCPFFEKGKHYSNIFLEEKFEGKSK